MQTEDIVLFPTTHEQSQPTFHVQEELCDDFIAHLRTKGYKIAEPPEPVADGSLREIRLEASAKSAELEEVRREFLAR